MTTFALRILALISMVIDHIGYMFFPGTMWFRYIGRLALPLYCFLIAEGLFYTRSRPKYAGRLFLLALVSEIPFDLFSSGNVYYPLSQNVYFTLLLGLLVAWFLQENLRRSIPMCVLVTVGACSFAYVFRTDYSMYAVLLIPAFFFSRNQPVKRIFAFALLAGLYVMFNLNFRSWSSRWVYAQLYGLLALVPMTLYNGKPGLKKLQWFFYFFYPAHLLLFYCIDQLIR